LLTSQETPEDQTSININQEIDKSIVAKYIENFDEDYVVNGFIGPSSYAGFNGSYESRPMYRDSSSNTAVICDTDILGEGTVPLSMALSDGDTIVMARHPDGIYEVDAITNSLYVAESTRIDPNFTLRTPRLMNVHDHANSLLGNIPSGTTEYLVFPVTDRSSISYLSLYKFTFYYRVKGTVIVTPIVQYFSDVSTTPIAQEMFSSRVFSQSDTTENTDLSLFDVMIPNVSNKRFIPVGAKRIRVILKLQTTEDSIMEIAYPILEHSYDNSPVVSVILPEYPSNVEHAVENATSIKASPVNTNIVDVTSLLFFGHIGRRLFKISLSYNLMDSNIIGQLRTIENFNAQGQSIVLRPKHHDMPPVMVGNMEMTNSAINYIYHDNDVTINFQETT
jgi:hypothetical protein